MITRARKLPETGRSLDSPQPAQAFAILHAHAPDQNIQTSMNDRLGALCQYAMCTFHMFHAQRMSLKMNALGKHGKLGKERNMFEERSLVAFSFRSRHLFRIHLERPLLKLGKRTVNVCRSSSSENLSTCTGRCTTKISVHGHGHRMPSSRHALTPAVV